MFEDYYGTPDLSLLQSLLAGEQGLPTAQPVEAVPVDAGQRLPTAQPVMAQAAPADERSTLLASLPPEYLVGVDASALDLPTLRNLARSATALSYEQNAAKAGGLYALDNPADYYQAYGAVPISFTGTSGYYDKGVSGPSIDYLTPDANASYTLYSPRSGEVLATGSGAEGLVNLAQQANALNAEKGRKADWQLIKTPAEGGTPEVVGSNLFNSDLTTLGKIVATGLPIATAFIPGLNVLGSIAAGAGAGGISAAMKDQNILKGALLGGATAGVFNAPVLSGGKTLSGTVGGVLGKVPVLGDALREVSKLAPSAAGKTAAQAIGDEIVVSGLRGVAPGLVSGGIASLANAFTPSITTNPITGQMSLTNPTQPTAEQPVGGVDLSDPNSIVVTGARGVSPGLITGGIGSVANLANISPAPTPPATPTAPGDEIVVSARKEPTVPSSLVNSIIAGSAPSLLTPTTTQQTPTETEKKNSLLNDIMKYYALGSGVLDLLGVGQGGGGTATMGASGTANLGVLPSFGRGAFTPYQGDYEQYGFGPEFNFFGGAKNG